MAVKAEDLENGWDISFISVSRGSEWKKHGFMVIEVITLDAPQSRLTPRNLENAPDIVIRVLRDTIYAQTLL